MKSIISAVKEFASDENGVTAIEYGLIAALVGVAMAAGATLLGGALDATFTSLSTKVKI